MLGSGSNSSCGNVTSPSDIPPLTQCLSLEPIAIGNQRYPRAGELRRALGFPLGNSSEGHSSGASLSRPAQTVATEEFKHFKESVQDGSKKARDRAKMFRESLFKLDKYRENLNLKKRQRSDLVSSERPAVNTEKMVSQLHGSPRDMVSQRLEQRPKNAGLLKRARTSLADVRTDSKLVGTSRKPNLAERAEDKLQVGNGVSTHVEEKIRKVPTGGEGWEKKIKRKRSVSAVSNRVMSGDGDTKQAMHPKPTSESKLRSSDGHGFRSKTSSGVSGMNKVNTRFESPGSNACAVLRSDADIAPSPKDRTDATEQRILPKSKRSTQEGDLASCPSPLIKGKVSRAPRTGSLMVLDSSPSNQPPSGAPQDWDSLSNANKLSASGLGNDKKGSPSSNSSSQPMAQWKGQRPHKNSRLRRANLVSPIMNHHEMQNISQGASPSELISQSSAGGYNGSLFGSSAGNRLKVKKEIEKVSSPFMEHENEDSVACENGAEENGIDGSEDALTPSHNVGDFTIPTKKDNIPGYEIGDGVRRQGRSIRGLSLVKSGVPPVMEKSEDLPATKPPQSMRLGSDRSKSKMGRPSSKKLKDRKAVTRVASMQNISSLDFTGELDDDFETLRAAANIARNACNVACSSQFWKKMKSIFAYVSSEDASYIKQQLNLAMEMDESLSRMFGSDYNVLGVVMNKEDPGGDLLDQEAAKNEAVCGSLEMGRLDKGTPLYQRVLSALIEDESEELFHQGEGKNMSLQYASDDSHCGSCNQIDVESKERDRMESEVESAIDIQNQRVGFLDRLSCNKGAASSTFRNSSMSTSIYSNELSFGDDEYSHSDVGIVSEICSNDMGQLRTKELNVSAFPCSDEQYHAMSLNERILLELQSIELYPEVLPDLAEEGELINQDISELKEGLHQQVTKKRKNLGNLDTALTNAADAERRKVEETAMNQLIEMAYKKRMACRGSNASKSSIRKVSKQVALAFIKRTLARYKNFEATGISSFCDPALQEVLFCPPATKNDAKSVDCVGSGTASNTCIEAFNHQPEARGSGAVSSTFDRYDSHGENISSLSSELPYAKVASMSHRGKKRELLIDDVGCTSSRGTSIVENPSLGGVKGKRSEKDNTGKVERKSKVKAKQKNNHHLNSRKGAHEFLDSPNVAGRPGSQSVAVNNIPFDPSKDGDEHMDLTNFGLDGNQDFSNFLNFEDDGVQDYDSVGLEVPPWDDFMLL